MKIAVLLVNYDQWDLSRRCLDSLAASEGVDIIPVMVDNCSRTPTPAWLDERERTGLRFRSLDRNTGFAEGNNIALSMLEEGEAEYSLLLNTDAVVAPSTVRLLADFLEGHPEAAVASSPVFYLSDPATVWSAGGLLDRSRMLLDQRYGTRRADLPAEPVESDFATGCAMMVRTETFRSMGGFRPDFFMYWEDVEFCLRLRSAGGRVFLVPAAEVLHDVAACSGGPGSPVAVYYPFRNRFLLARDILGPARRAVFHAYATAVVLAKTVLYPMRGASGLVPVLWRAYLDGIRGRSGPWIRKPRGVPQDSQQAAVPR